MSGVEDPEALLFAVVKFCEWRGCHEPDEIAAEALARGLKRLAEGVVLTEANPRPFFCGIAKNLIKEGWRAEKRARVVPIDDRVATSTSGQVEARIHLAQGLAALSPEDATLLVAYFTDDREALQQRLGISAEALRTRVHRIRKRFLALGMKHSGGSSHDMNRRTR